MASEVTICNQAISRLGGNLIISIDDTSTEAKLCKANYAELRDAVIQDRQWTFATERFLLPRVAPLPEDTDPNQFTHRYLIPPTVLTVIRASSEKDDRRPNPDPFRVEGEYITSDAAKMYVKAIVQVVDPNKFHPMFRQALAVRLAAEICVALTASTKVQQALFGEYQALLLNAETVDGMQGTTERIRSSEYIAVRSSGAYGSYIGPLV